MPKDEVVPWSRVLEILDNHIETTNVLPTKLICICYKHRNLVTLSEIIDTSLVNDGTHHFLDLPNKQWTIRSKSTRYGNRILNLTDEFVKELSENIVHQRDALISKSTYGFYGSGSPRTLRYFDIYEITGSQLMDSLKRELAETEKTRPVVKKRTPSN
jgi:hypothetical protein